MRLVKTSNGPPRPYPLRRLRLFVSGLGLLILGSILGGLLLAAEAIGDFRALGESWRVYDQNVTGRGRALSDLRTFVRRTGILQPDLALHYYQDATHWESFAEALTRLEAALGRYEALSMSEEEAEALAVLRRTAAAARDNLDRVRGGVLSADEIAGPAAGAWPDALRPIEDAAVGEALSTLVRSWRDREAGAVADIEETVEDGLVVIKSGVLLLPAIIVGGILLFWLQNRLIVEIAERERAEAHAREGQKLRQMLQEIADRSPAIVVRRDLTGSDRVDFVSSNIADFGYSAGDLRTGKIALIDLVHRDDRDAVAARNELLQINGRLRETREYRIVTRLGNVRWVEERMAIERDGPDGRPVYIESILLDVTQRRSTEEALRVSEADLANAQRIARLGSWSLDMKSGQSHWSDEHYRILGLEPQSVTASLDLISSMILPDDRDLFRVSLREAIDERKPFECRYRILRPDGVVRVVATRGELQFDEQGALINATGTIHDVTERAEFEERLRETMEQAELANRSKTEFLTHMSHELRTPLNAIIGFSEIIEKEVMGPVGAPQYLEYASDINASGRHLLELINDLLDLSKVEAGKLDLYEETFDLGETISDCMRLLRGRAQEAQIALTETVPNEPVLLRADELKIKQIVINLLSNAVKFTQPGGLVSLRLSAEPGEDILVRVADTGIGIAPEDIDKVMIPFGQADARLDRNHRGTGLGLPLSKSLVELHGGTLLLESEPDIGTTVTATLPAWRRAELSPQASAHAVAEPG